MLCVTWTLFHPEKPIAAQCSFCHSDKNVWQDYASSLYKKQFTRQEHYQIDVNLYSACVMASICPFEEHLEEYNFRFQAEFCVSCDQSSGTRTLWAPVDSSIQLGFFAWLVQLWLSQRKDFSSVEGGIFWGIGHEIQIIGAQFFGRGL